MVPVIALIGRPNVGKSTLFNRLTKTKDALVADEAGLTRDRQYGSGKVGPCSYVLVDTGGLYGTDEHPFDDGIDELMARQSLVAMDEADAVLFILDAKAGLTALDKVLIQKLRYLDKPKYLVVNKIDGHQQETVISEFYECGLGEPFPIAAAHNRGVTSLMEWVLEPFVNNASALNTSVPKTPVSETPYDQLESNQQGHGQQRVPELSDSLNSPLATGNPRIQTGIKISIVGRPNVGKSTLVNRLLGEERVVVFDQAGTTRDSIYIPYEREGKAYTLIDTAGVRRRRSVSEAVEKFSIIKSLQAIEDSQVCICVLDARDGIVEQDLTMLSFIANAGRALVIAINKWDGMTLSDKEQVKTSIQRRLHFIDFADIHFISAKHGTNVGHLYKSVNKAYQSATQRFSTSQLTGILQDAVLSHQPPLVQGRRIKLRYAHQGGTNPLVFVVHGNQTKKLPEAYKRYLVNIFRKVLGISGTPIQFEFKTSDNPYAVSKASWSKSSVNVKRSSRTVGKHRKNTSVSASKSQHRRQQHSRTP